MGKSITAVLIALNVLLAVISLAVGSYELSFTELLNLNSQDLEILLISRFPRLMAIWCAGVGLSTAGLIMQALCRNKFVSPSTGATLQSAQLGIILAILFIPGSTLVSRAIFSFGAAIIGTLIFVYFITKVRFQDPILVPLIGIMFGNLIMGLTSFLAFKFNVTQALTSISVGHFSSVVRGRYELVYLVLPLILIALFYAQYFNLVGLGRDFSKSLGINYELFLIMGLMIAAMLTAAVVSVVGAISYIGLIVPNLVAMYKGDNLKNTLADTALAGALFVLACDLIGRLVIYPYELPIELIIGILGSVIFIALILRRLNPKPIRSRPGKLPKDGGSSALNQDKAADAQGGLNA